MHKIGLLRSFPFSRGSGIETVKQQILSVVDTEWVQGLSSTGEPFSSSALAEVNEPRDSTAWRPYGQ